VEGNGIDQPRRVLVFRTGHLGDTVCTIPAFRLIRKTFPKSHLTLLCDRPGRSHLVPAGEVTGTLGIFDAIESYRSGGGITGAWRIYRVLNTARPDLLVMLPQVRETVETVRRKRRFFRRCGVRDVRAVQLSTSHHDWQPNEPERLIRLLDTIGISGEKPGYDIPASSAAQAAVQDKLREAGVQENSPLIIFGGGGKASTQCWPLDRYALVLKQIAKKFGVEMVAVGTAEENARFRATMLSVFPELRILKQSLTVAEMFELFRSAFCYLGNDTGPMHVAAAMGCPVVVVMSSRNSPGSWDPDTEERLIIRHRTECEDCFLIDCVVERHRCMTAITVDRVVSESLPFLSRLLSTHQKLCVV
jgi:ADP-heptose:LPS heptosyltransferase